MRLSPVLALMALSACNLDTTDRISRPPAIRIANAAMSSIPVHVFLNQNSQSILPAPLAFEEVSDCLLVVDATHVFKFRAGSDSLAAVTAAVAENTSYQAFLVASGGTYKAFIGADTATVPTGSNGLRFINATTTAGDVHVSAPGEAPSLATRVVGNLAPLAASTNPAFAAIIRPETATRVRLYDVGATTTPRADVTLAGTGSKRLTTIVFTQPTFTGDPAAIQVNACAG